MVGKEILKRTIDIAHCRAGFRSVKRGLNNGVAAGVEMPRARQVDSGAICQIQAHGRVVFANRGGLDDAFALAKQPAAHPHDELVQDPKGGIDKMNPEIDNTTAPGLRWIVKPTLLRPVGIVEGKIDTENLAELAGLNQRPNF